MCRMQKRAGRGLLLQRRRLSFFCGRKKDGLQNHEKENRDGEKGDRFAVFSLRAWKIVAKEKMDLYNKHICFLSKSSGKERTVLCTKKYLFPRFSG